MRAPGLSEAFKGHRGFVDFKELGAFWGLGVGGWRFKSLRSFITTVITIVNTIMNTIAIAIVIALTNPLGPYIKQL